MRSSRLIAGLLLILLAAPPGGHAEMDAAEYTTDKALATPAERQRMEERIRAERQAEAGRAAEREAMLAREGARQAEAAARRPIGERLTAQRCGACHALDSLSRIRHTLPGWQLVIARMRLMHGADIPFAEARIIASHLAAQQAAQGAQRMVELLALSTPLWLMAGGWWWRRLRGHPER